MLIGLSIKGQTFDAIEKYEYSSYPEYLLKRNTDWVNKDIVIEYFDKGDETNKNQMFIGPTKDYQFFVEELVFDSEEYLGKMMLEKSSKV